MDCGDHPNFCSNEDEVQYWKSLSQQLLHEKDMVQRDFDDYMTESQQLEKEYEVTIEQNEKKISELKTTNTKLQNEIDSLRNRFNEYLREREELENEIVNLKKEKLDSCKKVRELEQSNDDLERAQRMISESISAVESALNSAIERNAILESEIDEKESLKEKVQRLTDEARDLKQELQVRERCPDNERIISNGHVDSNRLQTEHETQTTPIKKEYKTINADPNLSPTSRILALNIVGDLLRKVGNLEAQLGRNGYKGTDTRRTRHTPLGRTSPSVQGIMK